MSSRPVGLLLLLIACGVVVPAPAVRAQSGRVVRQQRVDDDELETDRDSFTPATSLAGARRTILESSYSFSENRIGPEGHSFPELIGRRGVTDWLELRLGYNWEDGGDTSSVSSIQFGDEDFSRQRKETVLYGAKLQTSQQHGWVPRSALIVQGFTPTAGNSNYTTTTVDYVVGWKTSKGWKWDSGIRYAAAEERNDHFNVWAASSVLKVPIGTTPWSWHIEYFGLFSQDKQHPFVRQFISPGLHVLVNRNLEVGFRFGFGLNDQSSRFFNNVGVGWRY